MIIITPKRIDIPEIGRLLSPMMDTPWNDPGGMAVGKGQQPGPTNYELDEPTLPHRGNLRG